MLLIHAIGCVCARVPGCSFVTGAGPAASSGSAVAVTQQQRDDALFRATTLVRLELSSCRPFVSLTRCVRAYQQAREAVLDMITTFEDRMGELS